MSHRDCVCLNSSSLRAALNWLAAGIDWSSIRLRADCTWTPRLLATTALLWAWSDEGTLADRFWAVRRIVQHLFTPATESARTYQAFTKLLRRWTAELVGCCREHYGNGCGRNWPALGRSAGFVTFAVDGSRAELPRTRSHEEAYSCVRRTRRSRKGRRSGGRRRGPPRNRTPRSCGSRRCGMSARGCPGIGGSVLPTAANTHTGWKCCRPFRPGP